jgi:phosphatidylglycerophosphatase A
MFERLTIMVASGFWTGYLPTAPGTWGSLAILPLAALISFLFSVSGLLLLSLSLFIIGVLASQKYIEIDGRIDPPEITIDEMAAQVLVLTLADLTLLDYFFAFVLFRLFDIFKPSPIPLVEQRLPPALAVMLDDIVAALYAMLVFVLFKFLGVI